MQGAGFIAGIDPAANRSFRRVDKMKKLPLRKAFMLLEPGPVVLVTTADGGKNNVMTISWHMVMAAFSFWTRFKPGWMTTGKSAG
jgi:hypothetical protein